MNIIILHGDHVLRSFQRLQKFIEVAKKRGWEIQRINSNTPLNLPEALSSTALFESDRLFVVEQVGKIRKRELEWLKKKGSKLPGNLVIYHEGFISREILKLIPKNTKIEEFKLPKLIWKFLDSFYPGNAKRSLKLLYQVSKDEPLEFVLALLAKHLRDLYWSKLNSASLPYPSWRVYKLKKQAKLFSKTLLKELVSDLAEADIKSKTSKTTLKDSLDFLIASKLE